MPTVTKELTKELELLLKKPNYFEEMKAELEKLKDKINSLLGK